jgi:anti-anti-sigma factor
MVSTMSPFSGESLLHRAPVPRVSGERGRTVVWLSGEYDMATVSVVAEALAAAIAADDADLVVDLTEVQFIDVATISLLIRAREFLLPRSRDLTLRNPPRCAQRILDVCGLAGLIDGAPADSGQAVVSSAPALRSWVPVPPTDRADPGRPKFGAVASESLVVDVPAV